MSTLVRRRELRVPVQAAVLIAAVLLAALVSVTIPVPTAPPVGGSPVTALASSLGFASPMSTNRVTTIDALLMFTERQELDDVYPVVVGVPHDLRDVRRLPTSSDAFRLYGVLGAGDTVCLVGVFADLTSTSSCVPRREFASDGVPVVTHATWEEDEVGGTFVSQYLVWLPDGTIHGRTTR